MQLIPYADAYLYSCADCMSMLSTMTYMLADACSMHPTCPGARYRGEWKDGYMHGVGTLTAPNGAVYQVCTLLSSLLLSCTHWSGLPPSSCIAALLVSQVIRLLIAMVMASSSHYRWSWLAAGLGWHQ